MDEIIKKEYTEEEKLRAAYVLNMCTVSVCITDDEATCRASR